MDRQMSSSKPQRSAEHEDVNYRVPSLYVRRFADQRGRLDVSLKYLVIRVSE